MSQIIAMAGKGGTGKTTISGLLIRYLLEREITPVLAVDADSNANLNEVLGMTVSFTLGQAREGIKGEVPRGMTRDMYMAYKVEEALVEGTGFDLIVMGRPEGAGCYCHANTLLSRYVDRLCQNYKVVVMDNEAGMEHISRLVARRADVLLIVSDPTRRGIQAAERIRDLVNELKLEIGKTCVIVNRVRNGLPGGVQDQLDSAGLDIAGAIPEDPMISQFDSEGKPTFHLPGDSASVQAVFKVFDAILADM
jgi:CO dehydrogenase maturation factor